MLALASLAAAARWNKDGGERTVLPRATHTGELKIGAAVLDCAVLEDGVRVISQRTLFASVGLSRTTGGAPIVGAPQLPRFLLAANLTPYITDDFRRA
jgi:hypothetical protein